MFAFGYFPGVLLLGVITLMIVAALTGYVAFSAGLCVATILHLIREFAMLTYFQKEIQKELEEENR